MKIESDLWESFLEVTKGVFIVAGTILTVAQMLKGGSTEGYLPGKD